MDLEILHNEKHFLLCIKPTGVLSELSDGKTAGMVGLLKEALGCEVYPIHRLDREASGVMIYAKTGLGASKLSALASSGEIDKEYYIIVHGIPTENEGVLEDLLFKDSSKNKSFVVKKLRKGVKKASLEYKVVDTKTYEGQAVSLIRVKLHTGRTHQIRVQFSSRGMPVVGDLRYGSNIKEDMCLFSCRLGFVNPFTKKPFEVEATPTQRLFGELFGF